MIGALVERTGIDPETIGASGARIIIITTTLTHEMARRGSRFAVATMCVGVGQGVATLLEQVA